MYFEEGESEKRVKEPKSIIAVMIFSIIFIVAIGVYPDPFIEFAKSAVPTLTNISAIH
jgi:NADH-quinone oxidoreductase subunit N